MYIGGDILNVPTPIQTHDKLQSYRMNRRSEEIEESIYREYVESISVHSEVMAVLVNMPEIASIEQAKEYLRETKGRGGLRSAATRFWQRRRLLISGYFRKTPQSLPWSQLTPTMPQVLATPNSQNTVTQLPAMAGR